MRSNGLNRISTVRPNDHDSKIQVKNEIENEAEDETCEPCDFAIKMTGDVGAKTAE